MNGTDSFSLHPNPSPEDAAAVIAAIERFLAETDAPPLDASEVVSGWLRAALRENVGTRDEDALW